jgi:hypothetical protein
MPERNVSATMGLDPVAEVEWLARKKRSPIESGALNTPGRKVKSLTESARLFIGNLKCEALTSPTERVSEHALRWPR